MTATLNVRINNGTRDEIAGIVHDLDDAKNSADKLGQSLANSSRNASSEIARLSQEQQGEVRVINEQRAGWSELARTAIDAGGKIAAANKAAGAEADQTAAINRLTLLVGGYIGLKGAVEATKIAFIGITAPARLAFATIDLGAKAALLPVKALGKGVEAIPGVKRLGTELNDLVTPAWLAQKALVAAVGIGPQVLGATVALKGLGLVLDNTGKRVNAFGELETNLDRARSATSGLTDDVVQLGAAGAREFGTLISDTAKWAYEASGVKFALKEVDRAATESTDNYVNNARRIGDFILGVSRTAREQSERIRQAQSESADDFERVRKTEELLGTATKDRAEASRVAGLTTVDAIDKELAKQKELRGLKAAEGKFDDKAAAEYMDLVEKLQARRESIQQKQVQSADSERAKRVADERKASDEITYQYRLAFDARNKAILKENADFDKAMDDEVKSAIKQAQEQEKISQQLTAKLQQEHQKRQQAYVQQWQATVDRIADMLKGSSDKPGAIDQIKGGISRRDVAQQVGQNRADAAEKEFRESGEGKRREDELVSRGVDRDQAERRVMAQQRALRDRARARGFSDTMQGKNGDEAENAQNQLVQATAQKIAADNGFAPEVATALQQLTRQMAQASQDAQQAKALVMAVNNALASNGKQQRAINGSLK